MHVTKQEFVDKVATGRILSRRDAAAAVDAFLDSITDALKGGDDVAFTGFGKFTTQFRKRAPGRQSAESHPEGADPRDDRSEVLRR